MKKNQELQKGQLANFPVELNDPVSEIEQLEVMASKIIETLEAKNHDYAGSTGDFFANFRKHGTLGFLVRMSDKMARLEAFERQGILKVSDEKIEDTLKDLAGYAMLMAVYLKQVKEQ